MDATLEAVFQRVEAAFTTLVDSIAAYNPSLQAAEALIAADDELARGIDKLAQHRENNIRIRALRAEREALEEQFKTSVAALADLRRELFATPTTKFPEDLRPVPFDELLRYAKNIAQTTVPPTYREPLPDAQPSHQSKEAQDGASSAVPSNAVGTPAHQDAAENLPKQGEENKDGDDKAVTEEEAEWLKKLKANKLAWVPWPDDDKIRRGNLMQIQYVLDRGKDPANEDLSKVAEDEKDRIAAEAAAAQAKVQAEAPVPAHPAGGEQRQHDLPARPAEKPQKFSGFNIFEDDDESDQE